LHHLAILLELPGQHGAARKTMADAGAGEEILGPLGRTISLGEFGRSNDGIALGRTDRNRDHVERQTFIIAYAGIDTLSAELHKVVADGDVGSDDRQA